MFTRLRVLLAPATDEGLAAAISNGIEQAAPTEKNDAMDEGAQGDQGAATADANDRADGPGTDAGAPGDNAQADASSTADDKTATAPDPNADRGDGRNAAGRFVKKQGESEAEFEQRKAAAPADAKGAPAAPAKPPVKADPVNDPIPADLKGKTRERMEGLVKLAKETTTDRDQWKQKAEEIWQAIADTGTNADQFADFMDALTMMNSTDIAQQRRGLAAFRKFADDRAVELGETAPGKDPLEGHPDLQEDLEAGDITAARAKELAEARNRAKAETSLTEKRNTQTAAQREHATAVQGGIDALNKLGAELKAKSPAIFALKAKAVAEGFKAIRDSLHPSKWADTYRAMYNNLDVNALTNTDRSRAPRGAGQQNPQRPGSPANGGGATAVKSLEEAVSWGINQANRR